MKLTAKKLDEKSIVDLLDKKVQWLITASAPLRIILLGSAASGEMTEASDIDLIVIYSNDSDIKSIYKSLALTRPKDDWPHDLLLYTEETFQKSVQKGGGVCWLAEREGRIIYPGEKQKEALTLGDPSEIQFNQNVSREFTDSMKYAGRREVFGREDVIPAWIADMDFAAPAVITQALIKRAQHPVYGYAQVPESLYEAAQAWIFKRHGWKVEREWMVLCPGVVPSLSAAVLAYTQPGEGVLIQPPVYYPFFSVVTHVKRELISNPLKLKNGAYTIDWEQLESCAAEARLFLFCSPHNPIGRVWTRDELKSLIKIAEKHNLIIFSDEIHADLTSAYHKHSILSTVDHTANTRVITAMAPSKTFNIPGLNLSLLIIPNPTLRQKMIEAFKTFYINLCNPFNILAFETAYREGEAWLDQLLIYLDGTRTLVKEFLERHLPEIQLLPSEGTYLLWLDCRSLKMKDEELHRFLIHEAGVGLSPGTLFGVQGSGFMRLNIGAPRSTILQILNAIQEKIRVRTANTF